MLFIRSIKIILLTVLISNAQSYIGLWDGTGQNTKYFYGQILFHAELGYWNFELVLKLRSNPNIEISRREYEGVYRSTNDSTIILYTEKLFVEGFPIQLDDETKKRMTYSLIVISPGVGNFGVVKGIRAYKIYMLYKRN